MTPGAGPRGGWGGPPPRGVRRSLGSGTLPPAPILRVRVAQSAAPSETFSSFPSSWPEARGRLGSGEAAAALHERFATTTRFRELARIVTEITDVRQLSIGYPLDLAMP